MQEGAQLVGDQKLTNRLALIEASCRHHAEKIRKPWVHHPDPLSMPGHVALVVQSLVNAAEAARGFDGKWPPRWTKPLI